MSEYELQTLIRRKVSEHEMRMAQLDDKDVLSAVVPANTHLERIRHDVHNEIAR